MQPSSELKSPATGESLTFKIAIAPSLLLDVFRLCAALVVAIGHLFVPEFATGVPYLGKAGVNSVTVFFLLSGFVIRYVTRRNPETLVDYATDRASRIYSVLLPALVFTVLVDLIVRHADPGYYSAYYAAKSGHLALRTVIQLTFTSQVWNHDYGFFSNAPMWSLSYECFYYLFYGLFFYLRGAWRVVLLALSMLGAGPAIVFLFPVWIAGCLLFELFVRLRTVRWLLPTLSAAILCVCGLLFNATVRALATFFYGTGAGLIHLGARAWSEAYLCGTIFFVLLLWGLLLADRIRLSSGSTSTRVVRLLGEATFPLYLFHVPFYVLIAALVHYNRGSKLFLLAILAAAFLLSVGLGVLLNRLKLRMRQWLRALQATRWFARPS